MTIGKSFNAYDPWDLWQDVLNNEWLSIAVYPDYKHAFQMIRIALHEGYELKDLDDGGIYISLY